MAIASQMVRGVQDGFVLGPVVVERLIFLHFIHAFNRLVLVDWAQAPLFVMLLEAEPHVLSFMIVTVIMISMLLVLMINVLIFMSLNFFPVCNQNFNI